MTAGAITEGMKTISKLLHITRMQVLIKNQRGLSNRETLLKCLKFDSGYTASPRTNQNLLKYNIPNFVN